jgi:hypothetical protein
MSDAGVFLQGSPLRCTGGGPPNRPLRRDQLAAEAVQRFDHDDVEKAATEIGA